MCEKGPKRGSCTEWPQYNGLGCRATDAWQSDRGSTTIVADSADLKEVTVSPPMPKHEVAIVFDLDKGAKTQISNLPGPVELTFQYEENAKPVDDTMYHPNSATADCIADMLYKGEGGPFNSVFTAGSPSSECPSLREGPPQKGKIDENNPSDAPLILSGTIAAGEGIQMIENPGPMWKDTNGYWEPIKPRSCTTCKLYNDPICMKIATHIGTREEMWAREKRDGFQCIAALPKEEREAVITSNGCNRKEIR